MGDGGVRGIFWGVREAPGNVPGCPVGVLGGSEIAWSHSGASWGAWGASWKCLGGARVRLGGLRVRIGGVFGGALGRLGASWGHLGGVLGRRGVSWSLLGWPGGVLGPPGARSVRKPCEILEIVQNPKHKFTEHQ